MSEPIIDGWTLAVVGFVSFLFGISVGAALVKV